MIASDNDITLFAKTNFRNREVPFGIRRDDRRRHMYIIGKTGMGKTTLIENMVIQDIINGHGVAFVDPHGDSVEKVLNYIPANRINDVIYLNPADVDFPIAFNPLEAVDPKHKHLVASGLMGVFTKIWAGVWSPRMEYILQNTILALLDSPGNTMLGVARMYVDKAYRKKIVDNIKDPVVKSFWVDEFANYQDKFRTEAVAPIQNKVGQFLSNAIIRNIVGQTKSSLDLRDIMDNKKILLLNLSKGRIGEDSSALLGAMIITKLQLAAMSRVDIPEEERADFYLYVDEFQNFATESFANILSEARKYRLNLIVAHQYIGQLVQDRNTIVRDAIFGNVGTMITFRVGADDAEFLEKEFEPVYTMNDLVNLAKYQVYLKLMINGVASSPFSATTLPPIAEPTDNQDKVIKVSRERYATVRETVELKISKWLGAEFHAEAARAESDSMDEEGVEENMRFRHQPARVASPAPRPTPSAPKPVASTPQPIPTPAPKPPVQITHEQERIPVAPEEPELEPVKTESSWMPQSVSAPTPAPAQPKHEDHHKDRHERHERKEQGKHHDRRGGQQERRVTQTEHHPGRRSGDRKQEKTKHENPIWATVLSESTNKTKQALETITKSLQQSVKKEDHAAHAKHKEHAKPHHEHKKHEPIPEPPKPTRRIDQAPEPELPAHVHPGDHTQSPYANVQDALTKHGSLKPGETVKFD
ncbi:MAG TPA: type IV secretion system DNA-binding domain-containing protein [Candidatus Binatia bacterium]|nr:type IV secretion system DNA-binding domain-containing protein [Candidatus Binatia bacterium]